MLTLAGIVSGFQVRYSKKGNRFCIFNLEDQSTGVKCLAWSDTYTKYSEYLKDDELLVIEGRVESSEGQEITVILNEAGKLADTIPKRSRKVEVYISREKCEEPFLLDLVGLLSNPPGTCEVEILMKLEKDVLFKVNSGPLRIKGSHRLEEDLKGRGCQVRWIL